MQSHRTWQETYEGGSPEAERLLFEQLAREIMAVQFKTSKRHKASTIHRAFHAKILLGVTNASLRISHDLPSTFQVGYFQPGAEYQATVRLSNANGTPRADSQRDMRGAAVRIKVSDTEWHDLLMTNFPVSHARNARQFVAFAQAMAGSKLLLLPRLLRRVGLSEMIRMFRNVLKASRRPVSSLARETYWSRGAMLWGNDPVRYLLRPRQDAPNSSGPSQHDPDYLHHEIAHRLRQEEIVFDLCVQPYIDERRTPIEDGAVEWTEAVSAPIQVATLSIPRQDVDAAAGRTTERLVDQMAFNPWHTTTQFRPLGNLNRARKAVYGASAAHRLAYQFHDAIPLRNVIGGKCAAIIFKCLNRCVPWHRLPWRLGLLNLALFRDELRAQNLIDTEPRDAPPQPMPVPPPLSEVVRTIRTYDGTYNDLSAPLMGAVHSTFGRNMTPVFRPDLFDQPDPITVSRELMDRKAFIPARSLNLLAAAWIQFQVHDWVNHDRHPLGDKDHDIVLPLPDGWTWTNHKDRPAESVMRIAGNKVAHQAPAGYPVFTNLTTPWWDGSEVYGDNAQKAKALRDKDGTGAYIRLADGGYLPTDIDGFAVTGFNESWWLGLSAMHTLFAREHNSVCHALQSAYPAWDDKRIYHTARLIVSALIAKIHTVEWTPAILATKTIEVGLRTNWYGAPKDWLSQLGIWLLDTQALTGIPGTLPNHHTAPYSLTEEFVSVYRLHPLIPDDYEFFDHQTGQSLARHPFSAIQGRHTDEMLRQLTLQNVLYSFGIAYPGAITLHNYPRALQQFERLNGERIDLSVVDIVRDRRRGVPRFNDFRAALHKPRVRHWEELSHDPETVRQLREVYGTIGRVDTMVGLHAESPPAGFGFSETAFRVFILMASRRLQSDRFLTVDYRPEIYSPCGLDWIDKNGMTSVILRHCPELAPVLPRTASAFAPWRLITT
jgi:hypothetical protein